MGDLINLPRKVERAYYTLVLRDGLGEPWRPQFGSYSYAECYEEIDDSYADLPTANRKIIMTGESQASIVAAIAALNNTPVVYTVQMREAGKGQWYYVDEALNVVRHPGRCKPLTLETEWDKDDQRWTLGDGHVFDAAVCCSDKCDGDETRIYELYEESPGEWFYEDWAKYGPFASRDEAIADMLV